MVEAASDLVAYLSRLARACACSATRQQRQTHRPIHQRTTAPATVTTRICHQFHVQ